MTKNKKRGKCMLNNTNKKGFTLIELLLVVLIIGILAAIAIAQYQVAVMKTHLMTAISNAKVIKNAAEMYYLTHGEYPTDNIAALDIDIPGCVASGGGMLVCEKQNISFNYNGNISSGQRFDIYADDPISIHGANAILTYVMVLDRAQRDAGKTYCIGTTAVAKKVCKSMGY
jgi:prepilin-type N-terminal cleavage/methylation domain-containing protein